ncbi:hypothetical protein EV182_005930 [Spiromyces aspiralis]|uniref:Uncharacterized protein n=1 Tax=Spiromyces aspiralis TaxID=68401 RepID=A0ACC1HNF9_9FUNG|nr:hypothetical protein EV182_005930 [Spiromyces aspiralis]
MLGSFTKQTNALDVNKHMMKYIEENLKKRKQQELGIETSTGDSEDVAEGAEGNSLDPLDSLYQIPDHLRVVSEKPVEEGSLSLSTAMLTSIPEVDLGMSSRIKNIEETEKAKRRLEEGTTTPKQARATQDDPLAGLRYQRYRDISERHATATDAAVAERFKQRFKR